jgi:hypothetical protein
MFSSAISAFSIGIREVSRSRLKPTELLNVLRYFEAAAQSFCPSRSEEAFLASWIHQLYPHPMCSVRTSLIRIITCLELNSPTSLIERTGFDLLLSASIDQKPLDNTQKADDEKVAAFRLVCVLLKLRRSMPCSVLRALASLYQSPKHPFRSFVLSLLCEAVVVCPATSQITEVTDIFLDCLCEGTDPVITSLMNFIFEQCAPFVDRTHFISRLLAPLSDVYSAPGAICASLTRLLVTWPGLFCVGFQINAIRDILSALTRYPDVVLPIFECLLVLDCPAGSVSDAFSGFLLYTVLSAGLLSMMDGIAKTHSGTSAYLSSLIPYAAHVGTSLDVRSYSHHSTTVIASNPQAIELVREVSKSLVPVPLKASIGDLILGPDESTWDWRVIHSFVGVVLPHNDRDAQSPAAKAFYGRLLDYYSHSFAGETNDLATISDTLAKFLELLVSRPWGHPILLGAKQFQSAMLASFRSLATRNVEAKSPVWAFTRALFGLVVHPDGPELIGKYVSVSDLKKVIQIFSHIESVATLVKEIAFHPATGLVTGLHGAVRVHT